MAKPARQQFDPPPPETPGERFVAIEAVIPHLADKAGVAHISEQLGNIEKQLDAIAASKADKAGVDYLETQLADVKKQLNTIATDKSDKADVVRVDERVARVEEKLERVDERLGRVEERLGRVEENVKSIVKNKPDKADLEKLRTEIAEQEVKRMRWQYSVSVGLVGLGLAVVGFGLKIVLMLSAG